MEDLLHDVDLLLPSPLVVVLADRLLAGVLLAIADIPVTDDDSGCTLSDQVLLDQDRA